MLAISFPKIGIAGLAWIAPAIMLLAAIGKPGKQAFRIGYVAGFFHYLASLYWLLLIPVAWGPIFGWLALAAYMSLYPAFWVWLCWKMFPVKIASPDVSAGFSGWAGRFLSAPWGQRMLWAISAAAAWVALEMMISRFLSGFPWNLLGVSQYRIVPLIQIASYTGVYGVSFLVIWTSVSLLGAMMVIIRRPTMRSAWVGELILPMTVLVALYASGYRKLLQPEPRRPELAVALIQPSIPQTMIWDQGSDTVRFHELVQLTEVALTNKVDLVIWPEAAVPKLVRWDEDTYRAVTGLASKHKVWMIIGSDDAEPRLHPTHTNEADFFNSSFLVGPDGRLMQRYAKRNLVIFGEYVPLVKWLPFIKYLTPIPGSFTPGERVVPFHMPDIRVNASILICFEDVFPQLVPEYVSDDTDFLVNLTNNGWFGEGAAQWQHAAAAVFRAVENGVPLIRCCNNGLTCWIDSHGVMRQIFRNPRGSEYGPGFMLARIPLLQPGEKRVPTFYHQHPDWFGWACVGVTILQLIRLRLERRKPAAPIATQTSS
jgi:apolipoprotein N-acyltransferase